MQVKRKTRESIQFHFRNKDQPVYLIIDSEVAATEPAVSNKEPSAREKTLTEGSK